MSLKKNHVDADELAQDEALGRIPPGEIVLGVLDSQNENDYPIVTYSVEGKVFSSVAQATTPVSSGQIGRQVALLFANGQADQPIIIGFIYSQLDYILENHEEIQESSGSGYQNEILDQEVFDSPLPEPIKNVEAGQSVLVDGKRIVIEGEDEVVLKCGASSITLNKSGKIAIRGKYLLSRSSGVNRILGGSVQVN